jgi:hypothetical protein
MEVKMLNKIRKLLGVRSPSKEPGEHITIFNSGYKMGYSAGELAGVNKKYSPNDIRALLGCPPISDKEKYWANICVMQRKQTKKGKETYGQILEENTGMSMRERLEYLEEELIDALMYIEHIKALEEV